jgi:hypothetical protein
LPKSKVTSFPPVSGVTETDTAVADLMLSLSAVRDGMKKVQEEQKREGDDSTPSNVLSSMLTVMMGAMDNWSRQMVGIVAGLVEASKVNKTAPQTAGNSDTGSATQRLTMDATDKLEQRYLKGKFVLSTVSKPDERRAFPLEDRDNAGLAVDVVVQMCAMKLGVTITPDDLKTCHYTQNGSIVFRMGDLKYNSPYDAMVRAIKSGRNREIPVFFNFMLTRRRTDLLYHVRMGKRNGQIHRFFSDSDGSITIIPREGDTRFRITDSYNFETKTQTTMTVAELEAKYRRL